jgi:hypothetical protein
MDTQQRPSETSLHVIFIIEATSHCRNGKMPRWSFLVQRMGSNARHGMLGTNEQGRGLYVYASPMGQTATRQELIAPEDLSLPDTLSRHQANDEIIRLLGRLDWNSPQSCIKSRESHLALNAAA